MLIRTVPRCDRRRRIKLSCLLCSLAGFCVCYSCSGQTLIRDWLFNDRYRTGSHLKLKGWIFLQQGLLLATEEYSLPFVKRTVLEYVLPGDEGLAWWEGLTGLCAGFGLRVRYLDQAEIETLTRWVLNPNLEYSIHK